MVQQYLGCLTVDKKVILWIEGNFSLKVYFLYNKKRW